MTEEMRQKLLELSSGHATVVVIPQAMLNQVRIHHCRTDASRFREAHYRRVAVDRLELASVDAHMHLGM